MELAPTPAPSEEQKKRDELWMDFNIKCRDVGQLGYHIKTVSSQLLELEKQLDVAEKKRNQAAVTHDEYLKANAPKLNITPKVQALPKEEETPVIELKENA